MMIGAYNCKFADLSLSGTKLIMGIGAYKMALGFILEPELMRSSTNNSGAASLVLIKL